MVALEFESRLARRIVRRDPQRRVLFAYAGVVLAVLLVLNFTSGSLGAPQAVVQIGSPNSEAKYLGQYDGKSRVVQIGVYSAEDWVSVKMPFKGHLSDIHSITFTEFLEAAGGQSSLEPYIVIKMSENRNLACHPSDSYSAGDWWLPVSEWQVRDTVTKGRWSLGPDQPSSQALPFSDWLQTAGDANVVSISIFVGGWDISSPYVSYIGDITVNGNSIGVANLGRC